MNLHVLFPTRGRPEQAFEVLEKYRRMAGTTITIEVVLDDDDFSWKAATFYKIADRITIGQHKSKIEAFNGGKFQDWDVLVAASDDMVPVVDGWAVRVVEKMSKCWPDLDGALYFDDGYQGEKCCTLPILGRRLYDCFGTVYNPAYKAFFCDQEQTEVLQMLGKLVYIPEKIIEHRHAALVDAATYEKRKREGFDFAEIQRKVAALGDGR